MCLTLRDLSQLTYLKKEIKIEKNRLKLLENITQTEEFELPDLPQLPQNLSPKIAEEIESCKKLIENRVEQSILEYRKLCEYVANIEDSMMRQIITLRFIQGMSWVQVAMELGGGNSADSVRMMVKRFIAKQHKFL